MSKLIADTEAKLHQKRPMRKPNDGRIKVGLWVREEVYQRLAELRIEKNWSIQSIMMEALDEWLVARGEPTIDELTHGQGNVRVSQLEKQEKTK